VLYSVDVQEIKVWMIKLYQGVAVFAFQ